uniref:CCR4-NOT transcription complex subunit 4 n=1 Tax=Kalanchoe fedtschenkoi TaxID=63787 RepID=A0A7N0ULA7_KALFE
MSDKGEKTCPLCAEEMDLTDQQLKPCKCGYDICVWCWHHIMDMAEKDGNEGRCPACRVPYDKEKIVGMAANCGRVVAEINTERKVKSQKTKAKPSEGRKQLSSVRVVQRNLVYVVGLPLHLGDEDLLQHKEYFGRYGKVLKVSMSRTTTGAIQQFPNNTCSVYITYSKEEEAASCIQAVHGFTLEGRPLRACFGTTKYCHAWLRNMPCGNPDCLYLHEVGSQEDSFTKDEIVPAHTRVQEITGATTNLLCRSGNVLPPPLDENASNCTSLPGKPGVSNASNLYPYLPSAPNPVRSSPPNSSSGRPAILPSGASWGMRGSSSQPSMASAVTCDALGKQKVNATSVPVAFSSAVASTMPTSALHGEFRKKLTLSEENQFSKLDSSRKKRDGSDLTKSSVEQNLTNVHRPTTKDQFVITSSMSTRKMEDVTLKETYSPAPEKSAWDDDSTDDNVYISNKNNSNGHLYASDATYVRYSAVNVSNVLPEEVEKPRSSVEHIRENEPSEGCKQLISSESTAVEEQYDRTSTMPSQVPSTTYSDVDEDVRSFNIQRLQDSQVVTRPSHLLNPPAAPRVSNYAREPLIHMADGFGSVTMNGNPLIAGISAHEGSQLHASRTPVISNGYNVNMAGENGFLFPKMEENQMKRFESHVDNGLFNATDSRENSIISDILSIDLEFDGSLATRNLARLFSDVGKQPGSRLLPASWSAQSHSSNQSRFSFAREDESSFQSSSESSTPNFRHPSFSNNIIESRNQYLDKVGHNTSISFNSFEDHNTAGRNHVAIASTKISAPRGPPVSAPPGFSLPSRTTPPPGFTSFERADQTFNSQPGSHSLNHSLFRSSPPTGNMFSNGDIEFLDPAILAVGTGRLPVGGYNGSLDVRSIYPSEFNAFENEARSKLLMQRSLTPQMSTQNGFSYLSDNYSLCPQHLEQSQGNNYSPFTQISHQQQQQPRNGFLSNGLHHDGWRDTDSQHANNNLTLTDLIMNERLGGFNKRYNGFEDASAFRMPTSADLYNRSFGM